VPVAGGPTAAGIIEYAGPNGEPCVAWSVATTGTQTITATFDSDAGGPIAPISIFWDTPLPLIKEWG
jgi:hypothetical protein